MNNKGSISNFVFIIITLIFGIVFAVAMFQTYSAISNAEIHQYEGFFQTMAVLIELGALPVSQNMNTYIVVTFTDDFTQNISRFQFAQQSVSGLVFGVPIAQRLYNTGFLNMPESSFEQQRDETFFVNIRQNTLRVLTQETLLVLQCPVTEVFFEDVFVFEELQVHELLIDSTLLSFETDNELLLEQQYDHSLFIHLSQNDAGSFMIYARNEDVLCQIQEYLRRNNIHVGVISDSAIWNAYPQILDNSILITGPLAKSVDLISAIRGGLEDGFR